MRVAAAAALVALAAAAAAAALAVLGVLLLELPGLLKRSGKILRSTKDSIG